MSSATSPVTPVDLLVFGPHPDDIEIGLGGTVARHARLGHAVGLCDLTAGEMGSNGTPLERIAEAEAARHVLGAAWRINLRLPDRGLSVAPPHVVSIASVIRRARPRSVAIPYWDDRHPDHVAASALLAETIFSAGLRRFEADGEPWRPAIVCHYFINDHVTPSFVVDVSATYEIKRRALACHASQFAPAGEDAISTRLTQDTFHRLIESRDALFGAGIGAAFAEGVVVRRPIGRPGLLPD
ncbi:MAG TPA: bacillithiol biosynthesis deacetylase BshB1 [Vicinamibacterales bacterium]|nr:bacillithiol biosynthesis deacetylase BshB1 [Vicinamibacterales bacterium]